MTRRCTDCAKKEELKNPGTVNLVRTRKMCEFCHVKQAQVGEVGAKHGSKLRWCNTQCATQAQAAAGGAAMPLRHSGESDDPTDVATAAVAMVELLPADTPVALKMAEMKMAIVQLEREHCRLLDERA